MRKPWDYEEPLCAEVGTNLFFLVEKDDPKDQKQGQTAVYTEAKKICNECIHITECAEWGIVNEIHGMWGGLSPVDRERIRKIKRIPITPKIQSMR